MLCNSNEHNSDRDKFPNKNVEVELMGFKNQRHADNKCVFDLVVKPLTPFTIYSHHSQPEILIWLQSLLSSLYVYTNLKKILKEIGTYCLTYKKALLIIFYKDGKIN